MLWIIGCSVWGGWEADDYERMATPWGNLCEEGAAALSDEELLAILISSGIRGRSAQQIASDVLAEFGSLRALAGRPLEEFLQFKGLSDVKIIRIAAALEIGRRLGRGE
jgi:DNA repair protein RadC